MINHAWHTLVRGPMKWVVLVATLLASACDQWVSVEFLVSDIGDDSTAQKSTQIADALALRHGVKSRSLDSDCDLASYESASSRSRTLSFCVDQGQQNVSFLLTEWLTPGWSPKGDSLRRELEDTLRTTFGERVRKVE